MSSSLDDCGTTGYVAALVGLVGLEPTRPFLVKGF